MSEPKHEPAETKAGPKLGACHEHRYYLHEKTELCKNWAEAAAPVPPPEKCECIGCDSCQGEGVVREESDRGPFLEACSACGGGGTIKTCNYCQGEVAPVSPEPPLREIVARALWNAEIAESERKEGKKNYAQWPEDASLQPYCQSTYRIADALLRELGEAQPVSAKPDPREIIRSFSQLACDVVRWTPNLVDNESRLYQFFVQHLTTLVESLSAHTEQEGCKECRDLHNTICGCECHAGESASPRMPEGKTE